MSRPLSLPLPSLFCWLALLSLLAPVALQAQGLRAPGAAARPTQTPVAPTELRQADYIVAIVNSEPITNNEVRQQAARIAAQITAQGAELPARAVLLKEVLERLILEKIQVQLALETGITVDDYAVAQAEETVAQQNQLSVPDMHRLMKADGVNPERFRQELRNQLLALRVRERDIEARVRVTDIDIDHYLQEQQKKGAGVGPMLFTLDHILIHIPEEANPAQLAQRNARTKELLEKLQAGADFADMARQYSDAPEAASGGQLGQRPADRWPELFVEAVRNAAVGSIVGPLRSGAGLHLLKVVDKSQAGLPTTALQNHVRHILLRTSQNVSERQAAEQLQELRQRIERGQATFESLARNFSQDGSAKDGGDLGWAFPGRYVPEFEQAVASLAPGQISQPVVSRFGVHLIQLVARRQAQLSARERRDMVRDIVREKKLDEAYNTWIQELRARAWVEYREPPQ